MAQHDRSVVDDSQHSEICSGNSLHRVMRFDELDVHDDTSMSDDAKTTELIADNLHHERSFYDNVGRSTEPVADKLPGLEAKQSSSTDAVVESRYQDSRTSSGVTSHWHSTPSVHCSNNLSPSLAVNGRKLHSSEADTKALSHAGPQSLSMVTVGHCDRQTIFTVGSPLHCHVSATADDHNGNTGILVSSNKDTSATSPGCKTLRDNDNSRVLAQRNSRNLALVAAESAAEVIASVNSDKESTDCRPAADLKDNQRPRSQTTESVCQELSEMMRECVIGDDAGKQVVLNGTAASDADVSDSFDLDVAAKDLERAVSAGMLDFLLESYEDSDEDVSSEQMGEELDELSLSDEDDDDDDDDDDNTDNTDSDDSDSESTLTDSQADGSNDSVIDNGDFNDDDDDDVLRRHERIRQRMCDAAAAADDDDDGCDDNYEDIAANVAPNPADLELVAGINYHGDSHNTEVKDINCVSSDSDDDDDVLKRHERIRQHMKSTGNVDNNYEHSTDNVDPSLADLELVTDVNYDDDNHNTEVQDINCVASDDDDDDDSDDDVLKRHERIKKHMKSIGNVDNIYELSAVNVVASPADLELVTNVSDSDGNCNTEVKDVNNVAGSESCEFELVVGVGYNDADHYTEVKDINCIAASECRERVKECMDCDDRHDDDKHDMNAVISGIVKMCAHNVDDDNNYDDDSDAADVLARQEKVNELLIDATDDAADDNFKTGAADLVNVNDNCSCMDNDHALSVHLMNAEDVDYSSASDDNCTDEAVDRGVSTSENCMPTNDTQSESCRSVENMSPTVECSQHNVLDKPDEEAAPACCAEPTVCPGICAPCSQLPCDVQNADCHCDLSTETSLSLDDLEAGTTSTPSTCSHHLQTHQTVIEWREGVYTGLCRHSDGSEIRMSS